MTSQQLRDFAFEYQDEALSSGNPTGPLERGYFVEAHKKLLAAADVIDTLSCELATARAEWRMAADREARANRVIDKLASL